MIYNVYTTHNATVKKFSRTLSLRTENPVMMAEMFRDGYIATPKKDRDVTLSVWHIGTFDDKTAKITPIEPVLVCAASEFEKELEDVLEAKPA